MIYMSSLVGRSLAVLQCHPELGFVAPANLFVERRHESPIVVVWKRLFDDILFRSLSEKSFYGETGNKSFAFKILSKLLRDFKDDFLFNDLMQSNTHIVNLDAWHKAQIDFVCLISMCLQ